MTYVVTESCIKCKYTDCVDVCPVDCFVEGPNFLAIDPDECIDCTLCVAECPAEAIFAEDRPLVASVLINRFELGMPLGSDPTVMYALGFQADTKTWWKKDLTADDLLVSSPYNTRKNAGLPPTAICNPGLSSIKAALAPAKTDYLYFFSDKEGHLHFAATLAGHNANIKKYSE